MKDYRFSFSKFVGRRQKFLKRHAKENFVVVEGNIPVVLSAPHGVTQLRLGKQKYAEPGSLSLALEIQGRTNAHLFAKTCNCDDDANFDEVSIYKEKLKDYIREHNIKYLIDFHGLNKNRPIDINLGTNLGNNIKQNEELFDFLFKYLEEEGFGVVIDNPFSGGGKTVAGTIARDVNIWTIQIEVNYKFTNDKEKLIKLLDLIDVIVKTIDRMCE